MNLGLYLSSASCHFTEAMHYAHLHDWFVKLEKLISRQNLSQHIDFKTNPSSKLSIKQQVDICETALSGQSVAQLKTDCGFPVITQVCQLLWRQLRWETSDGFIFFTRSGKGFSNLIFNIPSIAHFPDRQAKSQKRLKLSNCEIF